jgi:putative transposase
MNPVARLLLVDRVDDDLSIVVQFRLLKVARSTLYWRPAAMRRMVAVLCRESWTVNHKRVRRLMRVMRIEAIYQKLSTSRRHPDHIVYPDLHSLAIDRPNQVWCTDITHIPMSKGFVYLVAVGVADAFRHIDPLRGSDGLVQS